MSEDQQACITVKHRSESFAISLLRGLDTTVAELHDLLEQRTGVFARMQKLLCRGKTIPNVGSTLLRDAGVVDGAKVLLLASGAGATQQQSQGAVVLQQAQRAKAAAALEKRKQKQAGAGVNVSSSLPVGGEQSTLRARGSMATRADMWRKTGISALRDLKLTSLPSELFLPACCEAVRVADLGGNRLQSVSSDIGKLQVLQKLNLSSNCLTDEGVPWEALASLQHLVVLSLDANALTVLPENHICRMTRLETLRLARNALISLPAAVGQLTNLRTLDVRANRLAELSDELASCVRLEEVDATSNAITEIPESFSNLINLQRLLLGNNRIRHVPSAVLTECTALSTLTLHGNPITMDELHDTQGFIEFEKRRKRKYDRQVDMKVMLGRDGFEEAADSKEWERWKAE